MMVGILIMSACGQSAKIPTSPVKGNVTLDNKPVAGARVVFIPESGPAAEGLTNDAGDFVLKTGSVNSGAVPGKHTVTVTKVQLPPADKPYDPVKNLIPEKYSSVQTSGLTEVVKEGANEFHISLKE